jgi:uncharacterized membrane protein
MIFMALDHVRDFFHVARFDPLDLTQASTLLFLTRWVTHHCAPAFVFLAGTGAFLSLGRGRTRTDLSKFLITRGLWLILLEITVIRFGWLFNLDYSFAFGQVIWAIGWSMIVLAGLVHFPRWAIAAVAFGIILLHNLFDGVDPTAFGQAAWLWQVLHVQSVLTYAPGKDFFIIYPLIPWVGIMAAGYLFGGLLRLEGSKRRKTLYVLGFGLIAGFVLLRATNVYGDPWPWTSQGSFHRTLLSFIDTEKYPPSLLYTLMTIGPAIAALPLLERWKGGLSGVVVVFGRVPLFYYMLHIYAIHGIAAIAALVTVGDASFMFSNEPPGTWTQAYGFPLGIVYLIWIGVVGVLYFPCRWFAGLKRRRKDVWLSYL